MKKDDMDELSNQHTDELPPRSSKYSSKKKWKPLLTGISLLSSIAILIIFQWSNLTTIWQPSFDSIQVFVSNNNSEEEGTMQVDQQNDNSTKPINRDLINQNKKEINLNFEAYRLTENPPPELVDIGDTDSSYKDQVITFVSTDTILQGVDIKRDFYYEVPISKVGSNNYLQLNISHSSLLDPKQSTLTVMVDDTPLKSIFLASENENHANMLIPLQKPFLSPGFHKITLNSHNVITDDLCLDNQNPANWVKIHATSYAYLDSKELWARQDLLKDFPYPFVQTGTPLGVHGYIVIPNQPSDQVLSAALTLSSYLSSFTIQQSGYPIITESEWMEKQNFNHIIAMGSLDSWNGIMTKIIDENSIQANANELTLDNFVMKKDEYKQLLLVSGPNDEVINDKISILSNEQFEQQLTGNSLRIKNMPSPTVESDNKTTLETIGFEDILLDGNASKSSSQIYTIPSYGEIQKGSYLDLMVKVSPSILHNGLNEEENIDRNAFTVHINEIPYGVSINQIKDNADDSGFHHLQIPLSERLLEDNRALEVNFTSNLNNDQYGCNAKQNNDWIFIESDSSFEINYDVIEGNNFKHWPFPYVNNTDVQNVAILIPNQFNQNLLSQLSNLYSRILSQSINKQTKFTIIRGEPKQQERDILEDAHVIIIGELTSYPFLQDDIKQSLVKWNDNQFDLTDYSIINETTDYVALMEPSFWNKKRMMTVFFNMNQNDTYLHEDVLDHLLHNSEEVDLVVRNKSGDIFTDNMQQKEITTIEQLENRPEDQKKISIATLIGFAIILSVGIGIFIYYFRKSKRL